MDNLNNSNGQQHIVSRGVAIKLLNISEKQMAQLEEWAGIDPAHGRPGYNEAELKRLKELITKLSNAVSEERGAQNASHSHEK